MVIPKAELLEHSDQTVWMIRLLWAHISEGTFTGAAAQI